MEGAARGEDKVTDVLGDGRLEFPAQDLGPARVIVRREPIRLDQLVDINMPVLRFHLTCCRQDSTINVHAYHSRVGVEVGQHGTCVILDRCVSARGAIGSTLSCLLRGRGLDEPLEHDDR